MSWWNRPAHTWDARTSVRPSSLLPLPPLQGHCCKRAWIPPLQLGPPHLDEFEAGELLLQCFNPNHQPGQAENLVLIREPLAVLQQRLQLPVHLTRPMGNNSQPRQDCATLHHSRDNPFPWLREASPKQFPHSFVSTWLGFFDLAFYRHSLGLKSCRDALQDYP